MHAKAGVATKRLVWSLVGIGLTCSDDLSVLPGSPLEAVLAVLALVVIVSSCCITAVAMAVAAAAVGAEEPFWTGEATMGGASTIGGTGVPASRKRRVMRRNKHTKTKSRPALAV